MFVVFALIATLPLMALSYLALSETRDALQQEVGRAHTDTARAAAAYVGTYVEGWRLFVEQEGRDERLSEAMRLNDTRAMDRTLELLAGRASNESLPVYGRAELWDAQGTVVSVWPPSLGGVGEDRSSTTAFLAARSGRAALAEEPRGDLPLVIAAPVGSGAFRGVLVTPLFLDYLGQSLQAFAFGPSEGVLMTDARGGILTHPDPATTPGGDWSDVEPVKLALAGAPGYLEFVEPVQGTRVLAGYAPVPGLGWAVVELVPASEAYAGLARLTAVLIVLSGVLLGGILLASVVLARRIVAPVRELTTVAGAFATGRLKERAEPRGDDEIAELGRTFNLMADRIGESLEGLRRSESRYRNLVESANDVILTVEPNGEVSFAGPQAERLLGWDAGDLAGKPVSVLLHEGDEARFRQALDDVLRNGTAVAYLPHLVVGRDGQRHVFRSNLSPIFGPGGRALRVLVVSRDVTTEQREERLREQSFLMARLVSEATALDRLARDGLAIVQSAVGATRGAVFIQAAEGLRAAASADADGRDAALAAVREGRAVAKGDLLGVPLLERGEALGALVVDRAAAEGERDALTALASQLAVGIRRSLFEQRLREYASELEARVEARTAELQAKNEEIESFLYSVSHDLKAPLISIEGYAEGLQEDYAAVLDDMGRQYLERIRKNATLMEKLILDLLELSRIGRVRSEMEDVDTQRVVGDVAARLEDKYAALGGGITVDPALPRVHGERNRIEQLFGNLLENAVKYRHPDRPPRVEVSGETTAEGVLLTVKDNGRGVPEEQRDALFKIFQRLPTPQGMPDPGGTGMGLAIVKRIVDTHRGRIWVEGEEGRGTTFRILLPAAPSGGAAT